MLSSQAGFARQVYGQVWEWPRVGTKKREEGLYNRIAQFMWFCAGE